MEKCGESVYEYDYEEEYLEEVEPIKTGLYVILYCPNCSSWRVLHFEHKVSIVAQTPEGGFDLLVDYNRDENEKNYYQCYDCGQKWN